jgi:hypothetical protein
MTGLLETEANLPSPFTRRAVHSEIISLEEAQREAIQVYFGSLTKRALFSALVAFFFLFIIGYNVVIARTAAMQHKIGGAVVLAACAAGLAYAIYEFRRKQRIFILEDSFAVERRFSLDVELIPWTDVAKLYVLDRTTETKHYVYFVPVATSTFHQGKLRIVLVDGREIALTNRVRDFSAMAAQFALRTHAAQLAPCTQYVIDGGTLDFDKFALTREGLVYKRKLHGWNEIPAISLDHRGILTFKSPNLWLSPRFSTDTLPNASLLLSLLTMYWGDVC